MGKSTRRAVLSDVRTGERSHDANVKADVHSVLRWTLPTRHRVTVDVEEGWVTLAGEASSPYQRSEAEKSTRYLATVVGVTNRIRVTEESS